MKKINYLHVSVPSRLLKLIFGQKFVPKAIVHYKWLKPSIACLLVVFVTVLGTLNIVKIDQSKRFDVFDEAAHFDYVLKLKSGSIPKTGDLLSQSTLRMIDCTGSWIASRNSCENQVRNAKEYPAGGFSYESQQPPIAYIPFIFNTSTKDLQSGRLFKFRLGNLFWYFMSSLLIIWISLKRHFTLEKVTILSACSLLGPVVLHAFGTVNNDAMGLFAGLCFLSLPLVELRKGISKMVLLFFIGLLFGLGKATFLFLPFSYCVAGLALDKHSKIFVSSKSGKGKSNLSNNVERSKLSTKDSLLVLFFGVSSTLIFEVFQSVRGSVSAKTVLKALQGFSLTSHIQINKIVSGFFNNLQIFGSYLPSHLSQFCFIALIAGLAISLASKDNELVLLSLCFAIGVMTLAIFWVFFNYFAGHFNFDSQTRYLIVFVPVIAVIMTKSPRVVSWLMSMSLILLAVLAI